MIKAVFFDFYYTLVGYYPPREQVQAELCREFGIEVTPEAIRRAMPAADQFYYMENARLPASRRPAEEKAALWTEYELMLLRGAGVDASPEVAFQILAKFGMKMRAEEDHLVLFDDVEPTLSDLARRGLVLGLVTNVDYDIGPLLERLGLSACLRFAVTSQDVGVGKPDPAIFRAALERAQARPEEAIHVGDQYHADVVGALNAGIKALFLDREDDFPDVSYSPKIRGLAEVAHFLD